MTTQRFFGKHEFAIHHHLEDAALTGNQFPRSDAVLDLALAQNFCRQTDSTLGVLSSRAVFEADFQNWLLHHVLHIKIKTEVQ